MCQTNGRCYGSTAGDTNQNSFFLGQSFGKFNSFVAADQLNPIDNREIKCIGDKAGADALNFVRGRFELLTGQFLRDDRALFRLDRHRNDLFAFGVFYEA